MARYNTAPQTLEITGATTMGYAFTGGIISLTGTSGYTVTLVSPLFFPGSRQVFFNATDNNVTLSTPAGNFVGNGVTIGQTVVIPTNSTYQLTSDGTNYVLTSALAGSTEFELPVNFNDSATFNSDVYLNPTDADVQIKPTGTGTVDISPQSSVSIQPGAAVTIRPTGNLQLSSSTGTLAIGDAGKAATLYGNLVANTAAQTVNISPTGSGATVTINPGGNTTLSAGGKLTISSSTAGDIDNMAIGDTTPGTARFTTLTASGSTTFTSNTASTSTTSGTLVVTGGAGVSGDIWAGGLEGTPIGGNSRSSALFTTVGANGVVNVTNTTASTSVNTGALQVDGGIGVNGAIYAGSIQAPIGNASRNSGAFTTLTANSTTTITSTTEASSVNTGALQVDGGVGINKRLYAGGGIQATPIGNVTRSSGQFTSLSATSTVSFTPNNANVTLSPSGTGTVTMAPAGGGSINNMSIGASSNSTGRFTTLQATSTTTINGVLDNTNTTEATNATGDTGALRTEGGISAAKRVYSGGGFVGQIGNVSRSNGYFTVLQANSTVNFTSTTQSSSVNSGALQVDGGVGINKNLYAGGVGIFGSYVQAGFPLYKNTQSMNGTTIGSSENAMTAGPVTINNGQTVTVSGNWSIV